MRTITLLICFFLTTTSFALSCPTNGNMLQLGDTLDKVLVSCGQPKATNRYQKTTATSEEWTYYNKKNNTNVKITLLFSNGQLQNINMFDTSTISNQACQVTNDCKTLEQNLTVSNGCSRIIKTGDNSNYVRSACGNPATQVTLSSYTINITELTYPNSGRNTFVFENGILKDWTYAKNL